MKGSVVMLRCGRCTAQRVTRGAEDESLLEPRPVLPIADALPQLFMPLVADLQLCSKLSKHQLLFLRPSKIKHQPRVPAKQLHALSATFPLFEMR